MASENESVISGVLSAVEEIAISSRHWNGPLVEQGCAVGERAIDSLPPQPLTVGCASTIRDMRYYPVPIDGMSRSYESQNAMMLDV